MKILAYENRKTSATLYDISTPEKEEAAYRLLFKELNEDWQVYSDLEESETTLCSPCTDGQHKYCPGEGACECSATPECKEKNRRVLSQNYQVRAHRALYEKALTGDWQAMKRLMKARHDYEYEEVREIEVHDPVQLMKEAERVGSGRR